MAKMGTKKEPTGNDNILPTDSFKIKIEILDNTECFIYF